MYTHTCEGCGYRGVRWEEQVRWNLAIFAGDPPESPIPVIEGRTGSRFYIRCPRCGFNGEHWMDQPLAAA